MHYAEKNSTDDKQIIFKEKMIKSKYRTPVLILAFITAVFEIFFVVQIVLAIKMQIEFLPFIWFAAFLLLSGPLGLAVALADYNCRKKLKEELGEIYLAEFANLKRKKNQKLNLKIIENSGIVGDFDDCRTDDVFAGNYKDNSFEITETDFICHDGENSYTVFKGVFINICTKNPFKGKTTIKPKWSMLSENSYGLITAAVLILLVMPFGGIRKMFADSPFYFFIIFNLLLLAVICLFIKRMSAGKKIKVEFSALRNKYEIFSEAPSEIGNIITNELLEKIEKLKKDFRTSNIKIAFFQKNILIAISTSNNLFEPGGIFSSAGGRTHFEQISFELKSVMDFIYFLIDNKRLEQYFDKQSPQMSL